VLKVLHGVHVRLETMLQAQQEGARLWLTDVEVSAIDGAVLTFCRVVPWLVEPSQEREEVLQELDKLRVRVSRLLFPLNDEQSWTFRLRHNRGARLHCGLGDDHP
jgi:hypothetical protein